MTSPSDASSVSDGAEIPAGEFSTWVDELKSALRGERDSDVACGSCTACCRSSQFVHIEPDETETLRRIPKALVFAAPRRPAGHMLLGYDQRGHCPMLVDDRCSIYEHRPRTCRTYDCRVLAAAGLEPDEPTKVDIAARVRSWRFTYADSEARIRHGAVQKAASFLRTHAADLAPGSVPDSPTPLAVLAFAIHDVFIDDGVAPQIVDPDLAVLSERIARLAAEATS